MTLSVPSFLAASTSAAIPPMPAAEVADAAWASPVLPLPAVFVGGEHAAMPIRVSAARAATALRRGIRLFTSDLLDRLERTRAGSVSYTHLRAHETVLDLVC